MTKILIAGSYPHKNYHKAAKKSGFSVTLSPDEADCLLLGGGGDVAPCLYGSVNVAARNVDVERDVRELYLIRRFLKSGKHVFGICRGAQIINVAFGGTLIQDVPSRHAFSTRDRLHAATFSGELKKLYGDAAIVNSAHHQAIERLGKGLKVVALSDDGFIEGVCGNKVLAVQFHPERTFPPALDGGKLFSLFFKKASYKKPKQYFFSPSYSD